MRSVKRGPCSGERPVRLRWSATTTGSPTDMPSRIPPAALVSTTVRQPAAAAVRTPCATRRRRGPRRGGCGRAAPARCGRRRARSGRVPPCPATTGRTNPGRSAIASSWAGGPMTSAAGRHPEPSTTATSCAATPVAWVIAAAAAAGADAGSEKARSVMRRSLRRPAGSPIFPAASPRTFRESCVSVRESCVRARESRAGAGDLCVRVRRPVIRPPGSPRPRRRRTAARTRSRNCLPAR